MSTWCAHGGTLERFPLKLQPYLYSEPKQLAKWQARFTRRGKNSEK
jgi:hypothetical protein